MAIKDRKGMKEAKFDNGIVRQSIVGFYYILETVNTSNANFSASCYASLS